MDRVEKILKYLIVTMISLLVVVISIQIFYRYVLSHPLGWANELSRYLFVWSSLFAAAVGVRQKSHIGVDILVDLFPKKIKLGIEFLTYFILLGFLTILLSQGWSLSQKTFVQTSPTLQLKMGYIYLSLPIFAGLSILFIIEQIVEKARRVKL